MRFILVLISLWLVQPMHPLKAQDANQGSSKSTSASEAHYLACIKDAQKLQEKYSQCTTDECRNAVTKDFEAWSAKCFRN